MYKFCKINLFGKTTSWVLEIKDYDTYKAWSDIYQTKYFKEGADNIRRKQELAVDGDREITQGHWTSEMGYYIEGASGQEIDYVEGFLQVRDDMLRGKLEAIERGDTIYCYEGTQWLTLPKGCEIVEVQQRSELKYPCSYTEDDIRVFRWRQGIYNKAGIHYYAKVGEIDVEIDGHIKWWTYEEAHQKALEFLEKLKKEM